MSMVERTTVSGRPATLAYVTKYMMPADAAHADFVRVLFDDGDSAFLVMPSSTAKEAPPTPESASGDPTTDFMVKNNLPLDRDTYIAINWPGQDPATLSSEDEAGIPDVFQKEPDEAEPMSPPDKAPPNKMRQVAVYGRAMKILDQSEDPMRNEIERELSMLTGRMKLTEVDAIVARLMRKITKIRTEAFKAAFRFLRDKS
jgi:hypothetical protein